MADVPKTADIPSETLRKMYTTMLKIREFEEKVAELYYEGKVITPVHLYTGQEAVPAGVCACLRKGDYVFGTHRSHGPYIAKGGDLKALMAEILGRKTGCSKGKGGSMHVVAPEVGVLGTSALVGGIIPLSVGAALASSMREDGRVSVPIFGDGATDGGTFHESLNLASLYNLPVVFICENNHYSSHLHLSFRQPSDDLTRFAGAHDMPGIKVDGNDVIKVYKAAHEAVKRAREDKGPTLIECIVNRWRGHVTPNWDYNVGLRSKKQVEEWKRNCPIKKFGEYLLRREILGEAKIKEISDSVKEEIEEAATFAEESSRPAPDEVTEHVYKS